MKNTHNALHILCLTCVTLLTLITLGGCSSLSTRAPSTPPVQCNSHAYLRVPVAQHLRQRYHKGAPVRMAILPFSTQENLAAYNNEPRSLGTRLVWDLQRRILSSQTIPIVEIFNRSDWPGKKEEFYHGNFEALERAAHAGYDLLLVGVVEDMKGLQSLTASAKLIEVQTGLTLWNSTSTSSVQQLSWIGRAQLGLAEPSISDFHFPALLSGLADCLANDMLNEEPSY